MYNAKVRLCHLLRLYYVPECFAADVLFRNHSRNSAQVGIIPNERSEYSHSHSSRSACVQSHSRWLMQRKTAE